LIRMKNKYGEVKYESDEIVNIIEEYYKDLRIHQLHRNQRTLILNVMKRT